MLGTAVLSREGDGGIVAAIDNLSAGGVLVTASSHYAPGLWVHVLLCLPGATAMTLSAVVVRSQELPGGSWQIAFKFDRVSAVVDDWLRQRVLHVLDRQNEASEQRFRGLVVGPETEHREWMVAELKEMGCPVLLVGSVQEAVPFLGQQPPPFEFVAVDAITECAEGVDLLALARRIYPELRCILIGDQKDAKYLEREGQFLARGEVLLRPCTREDLARAFGITKTG